MRQNKKNYRIKNLLPNQKGMALLTTLIFVFILVTFAVALLTMTSNDSKLSTLQRDSTRALFLADAGIEKALWYLNTPEDQGGKDMLLWRPDYPVSYPEPFIEGTSLEYYEITIKNIGSSFGLNDTDRIEITSVGTIEGGKFSAGKRTIIVTAIIGVTHWESLTYNFAIFTDNDMTLNGGISIDGSIHSNGDLTNNGTFDFINSSGDDTISIFDEGSTNFAEAEILTEKLKFPEISWSTFKDLAILADGNLSDDIFGHYYEEDTTVIFNTDETLKGIHFIDGDVKIQSSLILENATIFATGTIDVIGSGDVSLLNAPETPLALIAKGDITIGGSVHGEGIIQSGATITINGNVNIEEGAMYATDGVLNGGGGAINVVYDSSLAGTSIYGTGVEIYKKISWREAY